LNLRRSTVLIPLPDANGRGFSLLFSIAAGYGQTVYLAGIKSSVLTKVGQNFRSFLLDWVPKNGKDKVVWPV